MGSQLNLAQACWPTHECYSERSCCRAIPGHFLRLIPAASPTGLGPSTYEAATCQIVHEYMTTPVTEQGTGGGVSSGNV